MRDHVTVTTFNIGDYHPEREALPDEERRRSEPPIERLCDVIGGIRSDYFMLQEVPSAAYLEEIGDRCGIPHRQFHEFFGSAGPGLGFLGSAPFSPLGLDIEWPDGVLMGAAAVGIVLSGQAAALCNVHLPPVEKTRDEAGFVRVSIGELAKIVYREAFSETARSAGVYALIGALRRAPVDAVVVGGDFNTIFLSRAIREMGREFTDTMSGKPGFFRTSYRKSRAIIPARVDYLFYRGDLVVVSSTVVGETAGDHYPVVAEFAYSP